MNKLATTPGHDLVTCLYSMRVALITLRQKLARGSYISRLRPRAAWIEHGREIKTAASFRANLSHIVEGARGRGTPVLLMTFATHLPDDYTEEAFRAKTLDYGAHTSPLELWGEAAHVMAAIDAHNALVRELGSQREGVHFVDLDRIMPKNGELFDDVCHLTPTGSAFFAARVLAAVEGIRRSK